ncbi:MAG: DUF748 domain-containing protein [Rhodocyclaceae bacterium]|nr:DUF748 domain-containing protein [Rhodocyclaceae bacterium]
MSEAQAEAEEQAPVEEAPVSASSIKRWALGLALGLALYALGGFYGLPALLKWQLPVQAEAQLGRKLSLDDARFNPFTLTLQLSGLQLAEADGQRPAASIAQIDTDLEWRSLYYWGLVFSRLEVTAPSLRITRIDDRRTSWSDVIERLTQTDEAPRNNAPPRTRFSINNIHLTAGSVDIEDQPAGLTHQVRDLTLGVPFLSGFPAQVRHDVKPELSARINDTDFALTGRTRPFGDDLATVFDIHLSPFEIAPYLAYLPFEPKFAITRGTLATQLSLAFAEPAGQGPQLTLSGTVTLADAEVTHADGRPLLTLARVQSDFERIDVMAPLVHIGSLEIDAPEIHLRRLASGAFDWQALLPQRDAPAAADTPPAAPEEGLPPAIPLNIDAATLSGGRIVFTDAAAPAGAFATTLKDIAIRVENFAGDGTRAASIALDALSEAGEKLSHRGSLAVLPLELNGEITVDGVPVTHYAPYFSHQLVGAGLAAGRLNARLPYVFDVDGFRLKSGEASLAGVELRLDGQKSSALKIDALTVSGIDVDSAKRTLAIGALASTGGVVAVGRAANGRIDLAQIGAAPGTSDGAAEPAGDAAPWKVSLASTRLSDWALKFEDAAVAPKVRAEVSRLKLQLGALSSAMEGALPVTLEGVINKAGQLVAKGTLDLTTLGANLRVDLKRVELRPLQAYLTGGTEASLRSASVTLGGQLSVGAAKQGPPPVRFRGDASIANLIAVDTINATDFLTWKRLALQGIDVRTAPLSLAADRITLSDYYSRLILSSEGRLNFREITTDAPADATPAPEAPAVASVPPPADDLPPIRIGRIVLENGNVQYSDHFVRPNYDANLTEVGGTLEGLSSDADSVATLALKAAIDHDAPVEINGQLNPLRQDRFLDITATVRGFELPSISTYSGKYVGYGIAKGKLSADLHYTVAERKLTAQNQVLLEQLTFGDAVQSPDAVNLPVQLAVSLLKNRRGEIDLSVPVSGTLDDPQFSVAGLVWRAFFNLIGKAVTAPFALLGNLFGGGEELAYAEFEAGSEALSAATVKKLESLSKALADRPALKIELTGRVDPASDVPGLQSRWMLDRMREQRREQLLDAGQTPPPLEQIEIPPASREALLTAAYKAAEFDKPTNFIGLEKSLPVEEMQALMLKNAPAGDEALAALAKARAQQVRSWLSTEGKVPAERIFMVAPKEGVAKTPASRVDFSLK